MRLVMWSLLLACGLIAAQDKFEVASVKPVDPSAPHMVGARVFPGGRVVLSCFSLKDMVMTAFRMSYWQISGGEPWTAKDLYTVEAEPSDSGRAAIRTLRYTLYGIEDEHLSEMLQALLVDRFQLRFHRETKTGRVFRIERSNKPLVLQPADVPVTDAGSVGYAGGAWVIAATTMPQLAKFAADNVLHAPVVDGTGLSGAFDYRQPVPDLEPNYKDNSDSFLRMIHDIGLKMDRTAGSVEIFVIDHAAKPEPN
ncbi:MAG TPA: TIGR03435 family protein [Bryobacteraceae bacterium]|nr:TIGR03435 family protein [Bryobacteraceae bacterium]